MTEVIQLSAEVVASVLGPKPLLLIRTGRALGGGGYFIVMEHLDFTGRASQEELGRGLAKMHLAEPTVSPAPLCMTSDSPVTAAIATLPHCSQPIAARNFIV